MHQIFILSPAKTSGKRASMLLNESASFDLARRLRSSEGAPLGELFSFMSGLYFRGKYSYAECFARPPEGMAGAYVITSNSGLLAAATNIDSSQLKSFSTVEIDAKDERYTIPLTLSATELSRNLPPQCRVILLGSIATPKYVDILIKHFGENLFFPIDFIGRGDMSRGGLLLRSVNTNSELHYSVINPQESRSGPRPPKLEKLPPTPH